MNQIRLGHRVVTQDSEPYIIAEIGVNHEGSLEVAKRLIVLAKEGGADAVKFQTYKAETIASHDSPHYWDLSKEPTRTQFELFKRYDKFEERDYIELAAHSRKVGIDFLSTPFDTKAADFLDPLMSCFKVASGDITCTPFLRHIGGKGKPVLLSTGCSTLAEIDEALQTLKHAGCDQVALLHCVLNYPTKTKDAHLAMIRGLQRVFPHHLIGYSDHTLPDKQMTALCAAYLSGAVIIEKHFTHDKSLPGNDHYHSMDVVDLRRLRTQVVLLRTLLGSSDHKEPLGSEGVARENARRSIVLAQAAPKGTVLKETMLTYKRPGTGICPSHWDQVIGRRLLYDLAKDTVLQWYHLDLA